MSVSFCKTLYVKPDNRLSLTSPWANVKELNNVAVTMRGHGIKKIGYFCGKQIKMWSANILSNMFRLGIFMISLIAPSLILQTPSQIFRFYCTCTEIATCVSNMWITLVVLLCGYTETHMYNLFWSEGRIVWLSFQKWKNCLDALYFLFIALCLVLLLFVFSSFWCPDEDCKMLYFSRFGIENWVDEQNT